MSRTDPLAKMKEAMKGRTNSLQLKTVSEVEVLKIIKGLKTFSVTRVDYIDTSIVKLTADRLVPALTHANNLSIETATFPDISKVVRPSSKKL